MDRAAGPNVEETSSSRASVVRRAGLAAAALSLGGGAAFVARSDASTAGAPSPAQDREILNFALLLEYLQASFYSAALRQGALRGEVRAFAETVAEHERAHVAFLQKALGSAARPRPEFRFGDAARDERTFVEKAVLLEDTGVLAYNGQAANLTKAALAAAA